MGHESTIAAATPPTTSETSSTHTSQDFAACFWLCYSLIVSFFGFLPCILAALVITPFVWLLSPREGFVEQFKIVLAGAFVWFGIVFTLLLIPVVICIGLAAFAIALVAGLIATVLGPRLMPLGCGRVHQTTADNTPGDPAPETTIDVKDG